jgi:hypothetical protein
LRLSKADRQAVIEILRDTLADLPADFRNPEAAAMGRPALVVKGPR